MINDPMIGGNKQLYAFNDNMYFLVLKPVAQVWGVVPQELRVGVVNFFYNIRFPVRFINCLLQGKGKKAYAETGRFVINTLWGFLGMGNVAAEFPSLQPSREDLGQTFAVWGFGFGDYIMLPFLGPSSVRDGLGRLGDTFLDPIWWHSGGLLDVGWDPGRRGSQRNFYAHRRIRGAQRGRAGSLRHDPQRLGPEPHQTDR